MSASTQHPSQLISETRHYNSLRAACRLPEEVVCKIFIACARSSVGVDGDSDAWSWVNLTYVCVSWRRAALGCQDLWRYIDFSQPKWYQITLGRAKMSALHVKATVTDSNIRQLHRTLQLAHRIQDIHLTSPIQKILPLLQILAHPNPALESLVVNVHIPKTKSFIEAYDPPSFPTCGPPLKNLKYMELRSAPFYLLTSRCIFLTHFHLHDLPLTERPTLRYFLFMLEQLTQLQHLTLDHSFPINMDSGDVQSLERRILLPKLRSISLMGSVTEMGNILECIMLPASAQLVGRVSTLAGVKDDIWRLAQAIYSHSSAAADLFPLETLVLTGVEWSTRFVGDGMIPNPDFRQSLRIRAFRADSDRGGAAIDLTFQPYELNPSDETMVTTLTAIWKALSLSKIHTLALQDLDIITQKSWSQFLPTLPSLRVLDITGRAPSGLVWALLLNARSFGQVLQGGGGDQRVLVPRLEDVYLHQVDCSSGGYMVAQAVPVNSHCDLDDSRFVDVLNASLDSRRKFGLLLRSLSIARCEYVMRKSVEDARKAVSYLICDFRNMVKDEDVDEAAPARYRGGWGCKHTQIRHYFRLRTLVQLDS